MDEAREFHGLVQFDEDNNTTPADEPTSHHEQDEQHILSQRSRRHHIDESFVRRDVGFGLPLATLAGEYLTTPHHFSGATTTDLASMVDDIVKDNRQLKNHTPQIVLNAAELLYSEGRCSEAASLVLDHLAHVASTAKRSRDMGKPPRSTSEAADILVRSLCRASPIRQNLTFPLGKVHETQASLSQWQRTLGNMVLAETVARVYLHEKLCRAEPGLLLMRSNLALSLFFCQVKSLESTGGSVGKLDTVLLDEWICYSFAYIGRRPFDYVAYASLARGCLEILNFFVASVPLRSNPLPKCYIDFASVFGVKFLYTACVDFCKNKRSVLTVHVDEDNTVEVSQSTRHRTAVEDAAKFTETLFRKYLGIHPLDSNTTMRDVETQLFAPRDNNTSGGDTTRRKLNLRTFNIADSLQGTPADPSIYPEESSDEFIEFRLASKVLHELNGLREGYAKHFGVAIEDLYLVGTSNEPKTLNARVPDHTIVCRIVVSNVATLFNSAVASSRVPCGHGITHQDAQIVKGMEPILDVLLSSYSSKTSTNSLTMNSLVEYFLACDESVDEDPENERTKARIGTLATSIWGQIVGFYKSNSNIKSTDPVFIEGCELCCKSWSYGFAAESAAKIAARAAASAGNDGEGAAALSG